MEGLCNDDRGRCCFVPPPLWSSVGFECAMQAVSTHFKRNNNRSLTITLENRSDTIKQKGVHCSQSKRTDCFNSWMPLPPPPPPPLRRRIHWHWNLKPKFYAVEPLNLSIVYCEFYHFDWENLHSFKICSPWTLHQQLSVGIGIQNSKA